MNRLDLKKKLIEKCIAVQRKVADNAQQVVDEAQKSANEYGQPKDRYDSYRTQLLRKRDMMAGQLQKALNEINLLHRIDTEKLNNKVEFGSVVITDKQKMIVASGCGKIELDKEIYFAISVNVPIYKPMKDLKKGDSFEFRGQKIKIIDVF